MRIGAFELDFIFRAHFTLAEVINGRAAVLRAVRIRNVRGGEADWLHAQLEMEGQIVCRKAIRKLPVGDEERAAALEKRMLEDLTLPEKTMPGGHKLRLLITGEHGSQELFADIQVLQGVIPTDFVRARLLPAYVRESDMLRNFAADAIADAADPPAGEVARRLYDALLARGLMFQPVAGRQYPDCQRVAAMRNVLERGGSCAELSLLFASLLWNVGQAPALLLFEDHMAAGCFLAEPPPVETMDDAGQIRLLVERGALLLVDVTSVCKLKRHPFDIAQREILERLAREEERRRPCMLINVRRILRGGLKTIAEATVLLRCGRCGYQETVALDAVVTHCPACKQPLPSMALPEEAKAPAGEVVILDAAVQYALRPDGAAAVRLTKDVGDVVRLMDVWRGRSVVSVGERAFARSRLRAVILPDTLVRIGDYAFAGCARMWRFTIPDSVVALGSGAFRDSGLQAIVIPGTIARVPRLAFAGCGELSSVTLCEGTRLIDEKAFDGCAKLRSVTIPASVRRVAANAFPPRCELILLSQETRVL